MSSAATSPLSYVGFAGLKKTAGTSRGPRRSSRTAESSGAVTMTEALQHLPLHVAPLRECNAQRPTEIGSHSATPSATTTQRGSLKALALLALDRNGPRNGDATAPENLCNATCNTAALRDQEMDAGFAPVGYTKHCICEGCGPVLLWPTYPDVVKACPWCFRRKAGMPIPKTIENRAVTP